MKSNSWLPIIIMLGLTAMGIFVGVQTIFNTSQKRTDKPHTTSVVSNSSISVEQREAKAAVAVLRGIDKDNKRIGVYLVNEMKEISCTYDLATSVKSVNDKELVVPELALGSILNLELNHETGILSKIEVNKEAWDYKGVKNLSIDEVLSKMQIGASNYTYDAGLTIISGKDNVSLASIDTSKDILEIRGLGEKILSIDITSGHGVLDFIGYDDFIGGTVEIGYDVFDSITDNMKYVLSEGKYKVLMTYGRLSLNKVVDIKRNRTEVLKVSSFTHEMDKTSKVAFNISPSNAAIYIDGKEINNTRNIELDYGEYLLKVSAEGYIGWEKAIAISKPNTVMNIALALEKQKQEEEEDKEETDDGMAEPDEPTPEDIEDEEADDVSDETSQEKSDDEEIKVRTDSTKTIFFRKPEGAEASFDGRVIGEIPCEMPKVTGEHEILLRKDGYEDQVFTVDIEDDGEDAIFGFPEMNKKKE